MKMNAKQTVVSAVFAAASVFSVFGGLLDGAWLKGVTDKDPLSYSPGEEITFTVTPQGIEGQLPEGEYFLDWKRSDD